VNSEGGKEDDYISARRTPPKKKGVPQPPTLGGEEKRVYAREKGIGGGLALNSLGEKGAEACGAYAGKKGGIVFLGKKRILTSKSLSGRH